MIAMHHLLPKGSKPRFKTKFDLDKVFTMELDGVDRNEGLVSVYLLRSEQNACNAETFAWSLIALSTNRKRLQKCVCLGPSVSISLSLLPGFWTLNCLMHEI